MALAKINKVQLIGIGKHKEKVLEVLQNAASFEVIEAHEELKSESIKRTQELQKIDLEYANLDFAIKFLSNYGEKEGFLAGPPEFSIDEVHERAKGFDHQSVIDQCLKTEDIIVKAKNEITSVEAEKEMYSPWANISIDLENIGATRTSKVIIGSVKIDFFTKVIENISKLSKLISIETVSSTKTHSFIVIVFSKELEKEIRQVLGKFKFSEAEFPEAKGALSDYLKKLEKTKKEMEKVLTTSEKELTELAEKLENLKVVHDLIGWKKERLETAQMLGETKHSFVINGWVEESEQSKLEEELGEITNQYAITELALEDKERLPVVLKNSKFMQPFEAVTTIYGLPKHTELDPTPFLAAYFVIFFALCLTDAGYGLIMFFFMWGLQKKLKLAPAVKKLVRVLMYGGIVTFIIGALFGGWFGIDPAATWLPEALTYTTANNETFFIFQTISAISNPITVLILALVLGYIQTIMGVTMKMVHDFRTINKKDALLDTGTWVLMLVGIAFFIAASTLDASPLVVAIGKWWMILAALTLVLTQGRAQKNIVAKFFSGVLSLYGLVGYLSDILSYSRLLALGLATAIIGLAVNTIVGLVVGVPFVGWLLGIVVFIGGHIFNLLINALGSFIHSGRLQFVEFFTKFMEGGGKTFKPFSKKSKYLFINQK